MSVSAQFFDSWNPKVSVSIQHPPGFGITVPRVAIALAGGECADQVVDGITQLFIENNVEVIDRQHLNSILKENHFSLSGYVDKDTAVKLGNLLGPTALLFVKVYRCKTEKKNLYNNWKDYKGNYHTTYISRTQAFVKVSLQMVDLTTGRITRARQFEASPSLENKSEGGRPESPSEFNVLDRGINNIVKLQMKRMFFPWTETVKLYYYDDKHFNLRLAYNLLKAGDKEGALRQSLENIKSVKLNPKAKSKHVGRAYYNAGMSYFILGDYDKALEMLTEANRLYPHKIVTDAIATCRKAIRGEKEMGQFEERVAFSASSRANKSTQAKPISQPIAAKSQNPSTGNSIEERLEKLRKLFKKGYLTEEEYRKKKADIIKDL